MKLKDLNNLQGEELRSALKEHKKDFITEKKASLKFTDSLIHQVEVIAPETQKKSFNLKEDSPKDSEDGNEEPFLVTVVCNTANFCDSYMDVLTDDSYTKSIKARGTTIPHIADHEHKSTSHVGDVQAIYTKKVRCKDLGFDSEESTTALLMDSLIRKDYNEDVYKFYKVGKINQHSIGLSYVKIDLALNSNVEEDKEEKAVWDKYYPAIINKDLVDKRGYFWAVSEADIRENSCVLFGANALTPTLYTEQKSLKFNSENDVLETKNQGVKMNLEEAQAKIIELSAELTTLKGSQETISKTAIKAEQERILGIYKAADTLGIKGDISKFVKMNTSIDDVTVMFEVIKEQSQLANPSPKGEEESTLTDKTVPNTGEGKTLPFGGILEGIKQLEKSQELFAGIR